MKVVYVLSLRIGGPVTHLLDLAPHVAEAGIDVTVVCPDSAVAAEFERRGVRTSTAPLGGAVDVRGASAIWPYLRDADIVHTHDRRTGLLVRPQAALAGAAVVHTLHGVPDRLFEAVVPVDEELPRLDRANLADRARLRAEAILSRIGVTVVPSSALRRFLAEHGFPRERLRVVPNAVAVRREAPPERGTPVVVGTAALLEPRKGIDVLLAAAARMSPRPQLEIFGDGSARAALEAQARELDLTATFHGHVPDAPARLAELDVFVLPSRAENLPMAILEAMAWALPVVATRRS